MAKSDRRGLAAFVMRGRESLGLIRPAQDGLMLHTMYFADEVRDFGEIEKGKSVKLRDGELQLATRLIDELSHDEFKPEQYQDDYRNRVLELVSAKVAGQEITTPAPETQRAQVIDLMDALKQSLAKRAGGASETPAAKTAVAAAQKPAGQARQARSRRGQGQEGPSRTEMTVFSTDEVAKILGLSSSQIRSTARAAQLSPGPGPDGPPRSS